MIQFEQHIPRYHFERLGSTNDRAWELFHQGNSPPFVVTADEQTAGKGQWGRQWVSHQGGLYLSLLLSPKISIEQPSHLTISSAFGVSELLACYNIPMQIKWLNDLFLNHKKLGGILIETRVKNQELKAVVIGIGINWNNAVPTGGIALKTYLEKNHREHSLNLSSQLKRHLKSLELPLKIRTLEDLKVIVLTGLLFGYNTYFQEGLTEVLPKYEARLLHL